MIVLLVDVKHQRSSKNTNAAVFCPTQTVYKQGMIWVAEWQVHIITFTQ